MHDAGIKDSLNKPSRIAEDADNYHYSPKKSPPRYTSNYQRGAQYNEERHYPSQPQTVNYKVHGHAQDFDIDLNYPHGAGYNYRQEADPKYAGQNQSYDYPQHHKEVRSYDNNYPDQGYTYKGTYEKKPDVRRSPSQNRTYNQMIKNGQNEGYRHNYNEAPNYGYNEGITNSYEAGVTQNHNYDYKQRPIPVYKKEHTFSFDGGQGQKNYSSNVVGSQNTSNYSSNIGKTQYQTAYQYQSQNKNQGLSQRQPESYASRYGGSPNKVV